MIGLDTNVLIRYLTQDDPQQAKTASGVIEKATGAGEKLLVHPVVLCEVVWVLETAYGYSSDEVAPLMDRILRTAQFEIPEKDTTWEALADYRSGKGDFADYLLGRANKRLGAEHTVTFDRGLKECRFFTVL